MTRISYGSATDVGKRDINEDSLFTVVAQDASSGGSGSMSAGATALLIVADGMGGRSRGQLASRTAVKVIFKELGHILALRKEADQDYLESSLQHAIRSANTRMRELCKDQPDVDGMGTTATVAVIMKELLVIAHVGDTRAYLYRADDGLTVLTEDHSVVFDEVRSGRLSKLEAQTSKFRNVITKALGVEEEITPDLISKPAKSGDTFLLCSDGLHGVVTDPMMERVLKEESDPQAAADRLVAKAIEAGAKDNVSVIVAKLQGTDILTEPTVGPEAKAKADKNAAKTGLLGNVLSFVFGTLFVAGVVWLIMPSFVSNSMEGKPVQLAGPSARPTPPPLNLGTVTYAAPEPLLGRTVGGTVLIRAGDDMLVVDPNKHEVLRVDPDGQVLTAVPDATKLSQTPPRSIYWTSDSAGNLYASQTSPPMIRKYGDDGGFLRTIGSGEVKAPAAITAEPNGDVYVIDSNVLTRYRALPASAAPATPAPKPTT